MLGELQARVQDNSAFTRLDDYFRICYLFLIYVETEKPTRIISPSQSNYIFYQYGEDYGRAITRPLNTQLFIESLGNFQTAYDRCIVFLDELRLHQEKAGDSEAGRHYLESKTINAVVYTIQQSTGAITDSFRNPNQARKRAGQLFEGLIQLIVKTIGLESEPRTVNLPIPGYPGYSMSYELDLVLSRNKVILPSESTFIHQSEIVGSVETTSKDRIDKIFLDKYLLTKLLGRDVPVIAIFLHDVQRARRGNTIFGINSTFKSNHFLGYTVALNKLDGVYYVDPRPEMMGNERLREQIADFQHFLVEDIWKLSRE